MNTLIKKIMTIMIIIFISLFLLFTIFFLAAYSVEPWKKVDFSSLGMEDFRLSYNIENFNRLEQKYSSYAKNDTFIYVSSRAHDDTFYGGSSPYCLYICFWSYKDINICIDKIRILNEDLAYYDENVKFEDSINLKKNQLTGNNDNYGIISYSTPYLFDLDNYKDDIKMQVFIRMDNDEYVLDFILNRIERKGLLQAKI